jgi:hypothetical protein
MSAGLARSRGEDARRIRKVERGRCPQDYKGREGRMSAGLERSRGEDVRRTRKVERGGCPKD